MGNTSLSYEELNTLLMQIEGILNSRPLAPLSENSDDLTSGHFLIGRTISSVPEETVCQTPSNRLTAYKQISQLKEQFWRRWSKEYLSHLQQHRSGHLQNQTYVKTVLY